MLQSPLVQMIPQKAFFLKGQIELDIFNDFLKKNEDLIIIIK